VRNERFDEPLAVPEAAMDAEGMNLEFSGELVFWRGPAPWYFVRVPADASEAIRAVSGIVSYGWGAIPVTVWIGTSTYETSLFPKDARYLVPVKAAIRSAERLAEGDTVDVQLLIGS
jgi:hypothetical protein